VKPVFPLRGNSRARLAPFEVDAIAGWSLRVFPDHVSGLFTDSRPELRSPGCSTRAPLTNRSLRGLQSSRGTEVQPKSPRSSSVEMLGEGNCG